MNRPSNILDARESIIYNKNVKDNIKIACIGDIHISNLVKSEDIIHLIDFLIEENPDYICLVGDLVDSPKELTEGQSIAKVKLLLELCSTIAPTMIILGNHDFVYKDAIDDGYYFDCKGAWEKLCDIPNVNLLNDMLFTDDKIIFAGYRQKKDAYLSSFFNMKDDSCAFYDDFIKHEDLYKNLPKDKPKILLTHSPESLCDGRVKELLSVFDAKLTGHYHNGCVPPFLEKIYPKNAGIITPGKLPFPRTARGVKKLDDGSYLFLSGGWVKLSESAPRFFHQLDNLYTRQIDIIILSSDEKYLDGSFDNKPPYILKKKTYED